MRVFFPILLLSLVQTSLSTLIFFDDFDYVINRTDNEATMRTAFQAAGWNYAVADMGAGRDTSYLYTSNAIAGFVGSFPAGNRALALESFPNNGNDPQFLQTDYWVQYGDEANGRVGDIPANLWIQYWTYLQHHPASGRSSSYAVRDKNLYPVTNHYPGNSNPPDPVTVPWLVLTGRQGYEAAAGNNEDCFLAVQAFGADTDTTISDPVNANKLYQNLNNRKKLIANQWHLIKMHIDHSTPRGTVEAWIMTQGDSGFTKVMEWIDGVTPNFAWPTYPETRNGSKLLRMPTTENADPINNPNRNGLGTHYKYIQSFTLATSEADLPTFQTSPQSSTLQTSSSSLQTSSQPSATQSISVSITQQSTSETEASCGYSAFPWGVGILLLLWFSIRL